MESGLSKGVTNAPDYDQVSRTAAGKIHGMLEARPGRPLAAAGFESLALPGAHLACMIHEMSEAGPGCPLAAAGFESLALRSRAGLALPGAHQACMIHAMPEARGTGEVQG